MSPAFGNKPPSDEAEYIKWVYNKCFSYYLFLGMSYDEYWNGDPDLVRCYREAHEMRREAKNQELHLQGLYIYEAFASVMSELAAGLAGKKSANKAGYPEMPHPITKRELAAEKARNIAKTYDYIAKMRQIAKEKENVNTDC